MGRKLGRGLRPLFGEGAGSLSNTKSPGLRPTAIPSGIVMHPVVWAQYKFAENWGGGFAPFLGKGLGPHLTQSRLGWGLPPCQVPSWSVKPFGHNTPTLQTDRQTDRTEQRTGQDRTDRQRSDSIERTVLQTVAQKCKTAIREMHISLYCVYNHQLWLTTINNHFTKKMKFFHVTQCYLFLRITMPQNLPYSSSNSSKNTCDMSQRPTSSKHNQHQLLIVSRISHPRVHHSRRIVATEHIRELRHNETDRQANCTNNLLTSSAKLTRLLNKTLIIS